MLAHLAIVFGYKMKNEIPTMCSSVHTCQYICSMKAFDMNHRNCCMASTHVLIKMHSQTSYERNEMYKIGYV